MENEMDYITAWYGRLCATARQFELSSPETLCAHCRGPKKYHYYSELKCNLYTTSQTYYAVNRDEVDRTHKTIEAIEALAKVRAWNL